MYEYMYALKAKFFKEEEFHELKQEVHLLHRKLSEEMDKDSRKKLLRLIDALDVLHNKDVSSAFVSGFRLADGIAKELEREEPYSFAGDEEEWAGKAAESGRWS